MCKEPPRRPNPPRCATLQHVLDALDEMYAAGEIDLDLLREARSAILSYCRAAGGKPPSRFKADIVELLDRIDATSALREGFLPRRWSNLKSLLRRALNLAGVATKKARRNAPASPVWERLLNSCADRGVQYRLRPFAGFCTDHDIAPGQVDEAVLEAYAQEVRAIARSRNPTDSIKKVRRCWNKLVDTFPDELTFRARTWTSPLRWAHPIEGMPKSFQAEMALLKRARSPETFEEVFRCRPLKNQGAVREQCAIIIVDPTTHRPVTDPQLLSDFADGQHFPVRLRFVLSHPIAPRAAGGRHSAALLDAQLDSPDCGAQPFDRAGERARQANSWATGWWDPDDIVVTSLARRAPKTTERDC